MLALTDKQWSQLSGLLDTVLDLPHAERAAWIARLESTDPHMAALVATSLEAHASDGFSGFLEGISPASTEVLSTATLAGRHIGPYVIDSEIGRGGMGSVWRARRADGRYDGTVAIKFVHPSWIGKAGEQRFQQEGRVLARLNQPNIARLLDAGVLDGTQPYLVLEYVEGESLDVYCERQRLSLRARIELFLSVLQAVAHAHVNLIVHRDIKPGNVLVTPEGVVKLLDFGIAKLIDEDANRAPLTQLNAVALTPQYAAPEQLLGQPITTATDVYALGLMLYLLLTGKHAAGDASRLNAELIKSVLTVDAPRASRAASLASIDGRLLAGDLDNILHKATKKAPTERYASAAAFADDLRRFLANEPVSARPDTVAYRTSKFVRRHRLGTALAGITLAALTASVIISAIETRLASQAAVNAVAERARADTAARRAEEQRDLAFAGIARSQDITELTSFLLGEALPDDRPELTTEVLLRGVSMVRGAKSIPADRRAQMLEMIGIHFENIRDYSHAVQTFTEAHALALEGSDPGARASTSCHLASVTAAQDNDAGAVAAIDRALAALPDEPRYADPQIVCHLSKSSVYRMQGGPLLEEIEAAARKLPDLQVPNHDLEAAVLALLTGAYANDMRVPEAMHAFEQEEKLLEDTGSTHLRAAVVHFINEGMFFWKIGRPLDARANLERSQQINRERGTVAVDDAVSLVLKARVAGQLGDAQAAVLGFEHALKVARALGDVPVETVAIGEAVPMLIEGHEFARAERALPAAERVLHTRYGPDHWMFGVLRMQSALLAEHRGDSASAQRLADEAIALFDAGSAKTTYQLPITLVQRAGIEQRAGRYDAARADAERAIAIYDSHFGKDIRSASIGDALTALADALKASGNVDGARARFALAALHYESSLGPDHARTRASRGH